MAKLEDKYDYDILPEEVEEDPKPVVSTLDLDVAFNGNRFSFRNEDLASKTLTPILNELKKNPDNFVTLSPNTNWLKGQDVVDAWGLFGDADTSDELVEGRGETIEKWFTDRGVNSDQIKINITDANFNTTINVTGSLTVFE